MGTVKPLDQEWWRVVGMALPPHAAAPAVCKGPACPAFARCQGRCADKRAAVLGVPAAPIEERFVAA